MGSQALNLNSGLVSSPPPASSGGGIDLSAGLSSPTTPATQPAAQGTRAGGDGGASVMDTVTDAGKSLGKTLIHSVEGAGKDYGTGFMNEGKRTLGGILNILGNVMSDDPNAHYATPTVPVIGDISEAIAGHLKRGADWLNTNTENHGFFQHAGGFAENIAELMSPEALSALAKPAQAAEAVESAKALSSGGSEAKALPGGVDTAAKLADAGKIAKILQQYPRLASLVGLGLSAAARGSAETGLQTLLKTGGDTHEALNAAEAGGTVGGVAAPLAELAGAGLSKLVPEMRNVGGVEIPVKKEPTPSASAQQGARAYTETAREVAEPHLVGIGMTPERAKQTLNVVHDFTGVADQLKAANARAYDVLDNLTNGRFRQLNDQIRRASDAAFDGGAEAEQKLTGLRDEMENLLKTAGKGQLSPQWLQRVKDSWRQSYILSDAGRILDRSLDGLPGRSNVSTEQRGINGKELASGLRRLVETHGYDTLTKALGPGRIENLQAIADATKTNSGRSLINHAIHHAATYLGAAAGATAGGYLGGGSHAVEAMGAAIGAGGGHATKEAIGRVVDAIRTNPRIGRSFLYMVEKGTKPDVYGPIISSMITQSHEDGNK
jgi:hypothetical protein